jgi:hypothetical protein
MCDFVYIRMQVCVQQILATIIKMEVRVKEWLLATEEKF